MIDYYFIEDNTFMTNSSRAYSTLVEHCQSIHLNKVILNISLISPFFSFYPLHSFLCTMLLIIFKSEVVKAFHVSVSHIASHLFSC